MVFVMLISVSLSLQRLVVCLEESIYIHNIKDMKLLKTLLNTPTNPSGTVSQIHTYLVHSLLKTYEHVSQHVIFDTTVSDFYSIIINHSGAVNCILCVLYLCIVG